MMGSTYFEEGTLHESGEYDPDPAETEASCQSKGSFSLRHAHYFNDMWNEKIISHNLQLALVDNIVRHYANRGVDLSDLIKEGNLGLAHALENFELEGGSRFSTYAARCIRQKIERAIMSQSVANRSSCISKTRPTPTIADLHTHPQRISSRGAKTHHKGA